MPYGITQCHLPPGRGVNPAFTPAEAGTRFSDPGGMQGWVDLYYEKAERLGFEPAILTYHTSIWRIRWGWSRWNFADVFVIRITESSSYRTALCVWS